MDQQTAELLASPVGGEALAQALDQRDPGSLAAATTLRAHFPPELAAAALTQASLRARAVAKLGDRARGFLVTPEGLEQATRWNVAQWRAQIVAASGARRVVDLCCGLGVDAAAFAEAGLDVVAVERDPATAVLARANLGERATVVVGDAQEVARDLLAAPETVVFCDPARRTARGRSWDLADLSPSWAFVAGLLTEHPPAVVKLGPGFPSREIPAGVGARWVSMDGGLVECGLWSGLGSDTARDAVLLPSGDVLASSVDLPAPTTRAPQPGDVVYEPDPAVIRSGALGALAAELDAQPIADRVAYLVAPGQHATPFATGFEVLHVDTWKQKRLADWAKEHDVGTLEIKKRGLDVDPAQLRTRLRLRGSRAATVILTPSAAGAVCLVVERLGHPTPHAWHSA